MAGNWQTAVWGSWLIWVGAVVPVANWRDSQSLSQSFTRSIWLQLGKALTKPDEVNALSIPRLADSSFHFRWVLQAGKGGAPGTELFGISKCG